MDGRGLLFNGVDGETGAYLLSDLDRSDVLAAVGKRPATPARAPRFGIDERGLARTGWGVVFPTTTDPAIVEALMPLLTLRRGQASRYDERFFRIFTGAEGYRPGETAEAFLSHRGAGPGAADPKRMPYYLLLVGDPGQIPFSFQYQLDVQYAVGRLAFDTPEEYAHYAATVVAAEAGQIRRSPRVTLFGVANPDDPATALSAERLIEPLRRYLRARTGEARKGGAACKEDEDRKDHAAVGRFRVSTLVGEQATKQRLGRLLGGGETPALLLTASHGMGFPCGHPRQVPAQGAPLCQDWPGPVVGKGQPISPDHYFAADDVADSARPRGLIAFCFACFGAGTPELDAFAHRKSLDLPEPRRLAPRPFLARLPQRLLGHPRGGALAWIGHVERAWGYSFFWRHLEQQTQGFEDACEKLMRGYPVGAAMEAFNQRYAELATLLAEAVRRRDYGEKIDPDHVRFLWTAHNDARSYILMGDPAVRLAVGPPEEA